MPSKLAEQFLPTFDVSDELAVVVNASVAKVWTALLDADLIEVGRRRPLVGVLGALRALPELPVTSSMASARQHRRSA